MYRAKQGDIIQLDFNPQTGSEQMGRRPALVISNNFFNRLSHLALVCPISNTYYDFPLNVPLDQETKTTGSILCQHIKSHDLNARHAVFIEKVPDNILHEVLEIVRSQF